LDFKALDFKALDFNDRLDVTMLITSNAIASTGKAMFIVVRRGWRSGPSSFILRKRITWSCGKGDVAVQSANAKFVFLRRLLLNEQILRE
jgi:hypothetical protein